jgi:hypothetical protein
MPHLINSFMVGIYWCTSYASPCSELPVGLLADLVSVSCQEMMSYEFDDQVLPASPLILLEIDKVEFREGCPLLVCNVWICEGGCHTPPLHV